MPRHHSVVARCSLVLALLVAGAVGCRSAPPGPTEVTVGATDYAFEVPRELAAGPALIHMDNRGKVNHEMALGQLKIGVSADSVLAYAAAGHDPGDLADGIVGILIAGPGATALGSIKADLIAGRTYLMICQFRDADSLPPHIAMGMHASFVAH